MKKFLLSSLLSTLSAHCLFAGVTAVPEELETKLFADHQMAPSPAVIAASPYGDVFVGVDKQGSLGKKIGLGYIAKLIDTDQDGKADKSTIFATIDNPRGIISIGNRVIVLHCTIDGDKVGTQQLSVFVDADNDGVADGPARPLVTDIGNPKFLKSRGTDHSTNNIRLGIDGWIYLSIGDFGFVGAKGTDGKKLTMLGGGIVRVRPDGTGMETFIQGTRNVYDVAIDPFMNVVTRENNNDGVGWWIRFSHYIQSGQYGYPSLYTNFPEDMLPSLGEYGGGSGTGNLYLEEPGWPEKYNKTFMMADWGRSEIYIHRTTIDKASFTDKPEKFISTRQPSDLDVDASGRMYIAAWDGAGYKGNPKKGYVSIVTPKGWKYKAFPDLTKLNPQDLIALFNTASSTARVYAQQEILRRNNQSFITLLTATAKEKNILLAGRVAAIYTLSQLANQANNAAHETLSKLSADTSIREHCIRAMADQIKAAKTADLKLLRAALNDEEPRVQVAAAVALGRTGNLSIANDLIKKAAPPVEKIITLGKDETEKIIEIKGNQTIKIDADISTFKKLYLIVDGGANNGNDHVAWINPVVHQKFGKKTDLTTYKWAKANQGWGKTLVNQTCDGKPLPNGAKGIGTHANSVIEFKMPRKSVTFTATGILTNPKGSAKFIVSRSPKVTGSKKSKNRHSTPNPDMILPHVATQSLLSLKAEKACIAALNSADKTMQLGALTAMKFMHSDTIVDALISAIQDGHALSPRIERTLIRLHQKEITYDGSLWWGTRPNPAGPYYYPTDWSGTAKISSFLHATHAKITAEDKAKLITTLRKNQAYVPELNPRKIVTNRKGKKVGKTSIEDLVLYVSKNKGNPKRGAKIIEKVGCIACHNIKADQTVKGPDLSKLGQQSHADITASIIKPAAIISKSWVSITMKDGTSHTGTLVKKDNKQITLHNIAGIPTTLDATNVAKTEPGVGLMSEGLCNKLTLPQFADLIGYIKSMDKSNNKK